MQMESKARRRLCAHLIFDPFADSRDRAGRIVLTLCTGVRAMNAAAFVTPGRASKLPQKAPAEISIKFPGARRVIDQKRLLRCEYGGTVFCRLVIIR